MKLVYRSDGTIDFEATKAVKEGTALTPEELEAVDLSYSSKDTDAEFWGDSAFTEPLWSNPIY